MYFNVLFINYFIQYKIIKHLGMLSFPQLLCYCVCVIGSHTDVNFTPPNAAGSICILGSTEWVPFVPVYSYSKGDLDRSSPGKYLFFWISERIMCFEVHFFCGLNNSTEVLGHLFFTSRQVQEAF